MPEITNPREKRSLIFIVTNQCQLRCHYCYVNKDIAYPRMDFATARTSFSVLPSTSPTKGV